MRIHSNTLAMTAIRYHEQHQQRVAVSIGRLSSGKKINSAADDPVGMAISQRLKAKLRELEVYIRETGYAQAELDSKHAEKAGEQNILTRMYEIAVQVSSDTTPADDKSKLMLEFEALTEELNESTKRRTGMEIVAITSGQRAGELAFKKDNRIYLDGEWTALDGHEIPDLTASGEADGEKVGSTSSLIDYVKGLMKENTVTQSAMGAAASSLSHKLDRLYTEELNAMDALSKVEDVDFAKEMLELVKETMLSECSLLVAVQANALPENVLYLLERTPAAG